MEKLLAGAVLGLVLTTGAGAQAVPAMGTPADIPGGAGPGVSLSAHDSGAASDITDQVDRARRSANPLAAAGNGRAVLAATAADLIGGASVFDRRGRMVGTIASVTGDGVVVTAPGGAVAVPAEAFGRNRKGLMLDLTKAEFDRLVATAVKPG